MSSEVCDLRLVKQARLLSCVMLLLAVIFYITTTHEIGTTAASHLSWWITGGPWRLMIDSRDCHFYMRRKSRILEKFRSPLISTLESGACFVSGWSAKTANPNDFRVKFRSLGSNCGRATARISAQCMAPHIRGFDG